MHVVQYYTVHTNTQTHTVVVRVRVVRSSYAPTAHGCILRAQRVTSPQAIVIAQAVDTAAIALAPPCRSAAACVVARKFRQFGVPQQQASLTHASISGPTSFGAAWAVALARTETDSPAAAHTRAHVALIEAAGALTAVALQSFGRRGAERRNEAPRSVTPPAMPSAGYQRTVEQRAPDPAAAAHLP